MTQATLSNDTVLERAFLGKLCKILTFLSQNDESPNKGVWLSVSAVLNIEAVWSYNLSHSSIIQGVNENYSKEGENKKVQDLNALSCLAITKTDKRYFY